MKQWMLVLSLVFATAGEAQQSRFEIEFGGAVVHVFSGNVKRAVAINLAHHTPILVTSVIDSASRKLLKDEFGKTADCDPNVCIIDMKGLKLNLAASADGIILPSIDPGTTFNLQVPHLQKLALDPANHPFRISADATGAYPKGAVLAMFDFTGGELTSEAFRAECKSRYDPEVIKQDAFTSS